MAVISTYYKIDGEEYVKAKDYDDILYKLKKANDEISELESELSAKENLLKIKKMNDIRELASISKRSALKINGFTKEEIDEMLGEEEPLQFSCDECEKEIKTELPAAPIDVALMLINEKEYQSKCSSSSNGFNQTFEVLSSKKYSKNDLREISEHLIVYCNNSDENEEDTQS